MTRFVSRLAAVAVVCALAGAAQAQQRIGVGITFDDGAAINVSPANKARLRYHLGNNRLEVSYNGAAYAALAGGGGSGYATIANNAVNLTARTLLNCDGTLVVCSDNGGATRTDITLGASVVTATSTNTLTNKTLTSPAISNPSLSGTSSGTYTLGGAPTIGADVTLSAGVDIVGSSTSDITARFHLGSGSAPTCTLNTTVNGTGGSCSVTGNAQVGKVTVTTGGTPGGFTANTDWFTLTHAGAYACANGTAVQYFCADADCAVLFNQFTVAESYYAATTTTTAAFSTAYTLAPYPFAATAYEFFYRLDCY